MSTVVDELVTLLGFKLSPESVESIKKYTDYMGKAKEHAQKLYVGLMTAGAAVQAFAMKSMLSGSELYKFGELIGQSTEDIQKWAYAMEQAGGSGDSMKNDMATLTKALRPVMPGEYNQGLYGLLGFDYTSLKDVDSLMMAINKRFQGMSQVKAVNWASQIGLSPQTAVLMRKPWEEIKGMFAEMEGMGGLVSDENLEKSREFEKQYDKIKTALTGISLTIAGEMAPAAEDMLRIWQEWLTNNKEWLSSKITEGMHLFDQAIRSATETIQWMVSSIRELLGPLEKYTQYIDWAKVILWSLTGATIAFAVATIAAVGPWILLGAGIAAAGYIIYDAIRYFRDMGVETDGITSKISEFAAKFKDHFPGITALVTELYYWVKMLAKVFTSLVLNITTPLFKLIGDVMGAIVTGIDKALQKVGVTLDNAKVFAEEMKKLEDQGEEGSKTIADALNATDEEVKKNAPHLFDNGYKYGGAPTAPTTTTTTTPENKDKERREEKKNDDLSMLKMASEKTNSFLQSIASGINNLSMLETFSFLSDLGGPGFLQELLSPTVPGSGSGNTVPYAPNTTVNQNNVFNVNSSDPKRGANEIYDRMQGPYSRRILDAIFSGSPLAPAGS